MLPQSQQNNQRDITMAGGAATPAANTTLDDPANVRLWLRSNHPKQLALLDDFDITIRLGKDSSRGCDQGTYKYGRERLPIAARTVELLRSIVGSTRWTTAAQLLILLRGIGNELGGGRRREPAIGNMIRRVMYAVRDETDRGATEDEAAESAMDEDVDEGRGGSGGRVGGGGVAGGMTSSGTLRRNKESFLSSMLWAHPQQPVNNMRHRRDQSGQSSSGGGGGDRLRSDSFGCGAETDQYTSTITPSMCFPPHYHVRRDDLRPSVMEAIQEMMSELEDLHRNINEQAIQHIHNGEIILTYAYSRTVELFLKAAAMKKRKFQVIVCEGSPHFGGHVLAKSLAEAGIDTTVIHDAATFAIMARVNKVLLPAHAVLANGGLVAPSGSNMVALAAKHNSVPVVTVAGLFKLCPMYPHEGQDTLNDLISPSAVVDYRLMGDPLLSEVEFVNPVHDYIPPQLIDLYVTNIGGFQPSYIYRLLAECYHSDDWEAFYE